MPATTDELKRVAEIVATRVAGVVGSAVVVADERGRMIARNGPHGVDAPWDAQRGATGEVPAAHATMRLDGREGQVIVYAQAADGPMSPRLVQGVVDLVVDQTAITARLLSHPELKNKFIHDLLHGPVGDESTVVREAEILGMDLTRPRSVILIDAAEYILSAGRLSRAQREVRAHGRAQAVIDSVVSFFHLPDDTICAYIGAGEVVVLKASSTQDLRAWAEGDGADVVSPSWANLGALKRAGSALLARLRRDTKAAINVGIGRYHPGIGGLARSCADARAALSLGRRVHGDNQVHCLDSLGLAAFVGIADEHTKAGLARHLLSPLDDTPSLVATLEAFFADNCCPSSAAVQLAIHRNTLTYRLDRVASLTGLDPRHFDDAVQIRLALAVRSLQDTATTQPRGAWAAETRVSVA